MTGTMRAVVLVLGIETVGVVAGRCDFRSSAPGGRLARLSDAEPMATMSLGGASTTKR